MNYGSLDQLSKAFPLFPIFTTARNHGLKSFVIIDIN